MKVAMIQTIWQKDPRDNLISACKAVENSCLENSVDIVCLPEFFLGPPWYMPGQNSLKGITDTTIPGSVTEEFRKLARKHKVYILLGSMVEELADGNYCNTAILLDRNGEIAGRAHKVHMFANEMVVCKPGENIDVIDTEFGLIGIAVCSDFWVPETIRMLALKGAHTIFIPGGSLKQNLDAMINAFSTTAYLNCVNLIYISPVGEVHGIRGGRQITVSFAGTSLAATPKGILAKAPSDDASTEIVNISPKEIEELRIPSKTDDSWQSLILRNPNAYRYLLQNYADMGRDLVAETQTSIQQTSAVSEAINKVTEDFTVGK